MEKLYAKVRGKLCYHEGWMEGRKAIEHWGVVGEEGETREWTSTKGKSAKAALEEALAAARKAGYAPVDENAHAVLAIEYATGSNARKDLAKRHALEGWLDNALGWAGLGHCDGGSIGSGTMEAFCVVVDYALAKSVIAKAIAATEFADFKRIYQDKRAKPVPNVKRLRKAGFTPGDCLSVKLPDGRYTAAYVAGTHEERGERPSNVVVELDYLERSPPQLAQFEKMKPLVLTHHKWKGDVSINISPARSKSVDAWIEVAGNMALDLAGVQVELVDGDWVNWKAVPDAAIMKIIGLAARVVGKKSPAGRYISTTMDWSVGTQIVMQRRWDAGDRSDIEH